MAPPPPLDEDDDYEDPLEEAIGAQRVRLSDQEVCDLWDIIPPRIDVVGVPFVTRLTSTMIDMIWYVILTNANYPTNYLVYSPMIWYVVWNLVDDMF